MKRQVLLPLVTHPDPNPEAVVRNAAAIAVWLEADLHALTLNAQIPSVSNALSRLLLDVPGMIREAETASRGHAERLAAAVTQAAEKADIHATVEALSLDPAALAEAAAVRARYFDLALVGLDSGNAAARSVAEAVLFGSGRPVVLLPDAALAGKAGHVTIAWDGSRVAARAVADAGPLLERATRICVLTVVDEKPLHDRESGERLVRVLRDRGLPAECVAARAEDRPIGQMLQERALEMSADLLVMGGYGHSRVRDFVLGGATRGILGDLRLPVLISH